MSLWMIALLFVLFSCLFGLIVARLFFGGGK